MSDRERRFFSRTVIVTIEIAVFAVLLVVSLGGLRFARERIDRIAAQVGEQVSMQVAERLGVTITYGSIALSALRSLQVRDLELRTLDGDLVASASRLRIFYSLRILMSTRSALDAVDRVEVIGVDADLSLPRDRTTLLLGIGALSDSGAVRNDMLPWPLEISEARITVSFGGADQVDLADLSLRLQPKQDDGQIHLNGRAKLTAEIAGVAGHDVGLNTLMHVEGSFGTGQIGVEALVHVEKVQSTIGNLEARDFQVEWDGSTIQLNTGDNRGSFALKVVIDPANRTLQFGIDADEMRPLQVFKPSGPIENLTTLLDTTISGTAIVIADTTVADPSAAVSYRGTASFLAPPELLSNLVDEPVQVTVSAQGDPATVMFAPLTFHTADGIAHFTGAVDLLERRATGRLMMEDLYLEGRSIRASAEVEVDGSGLRMTLREGSLVFGDVDVSDLTGSINFSEMPPSDAAGNYPPSLLVDLNGTLLESPHGRAAVVGMVTISAEPRFTGRIHVDEMNAGALYRLVQPPGLRSPETVAFTDDMTVSGLLEGSASQDRFQFTVSAASIAWIDSPLSARFNAIASTDRLRIADLDLLVGDTIRAFGSVDIGGAEDLSFVGRISLDGVDLPGTIQLEAGDGITVRGPYGLVFEAWTGELLSLRDLLDRILGSADGQPMPFRMTIEDYPLLAISNKTTATAQLSGTVNNLQALFAGLSPDAELNLNVAGVEFETSHLLLHNVPMGELENELEIDLEYDQASLTAHRFRFTNEDLVLTGDGSLKVETHDGLRAAGRFLLQTGQEQYDAVIEFTPELLDLDVGVQRMPLHRLGELPISGTVSGRVHITGSVAQPIIHAVVTADDARFNGDDLTLAVAATYDGASLMIDDLAFDYRIHHIRGVTGKIDATTGAVAFLGRYEGKYLGKSVVFELAVNGNGTVPAEMSSKQSFPLEAVLTLAATGVTVDDVPRTPWEATVHWTKGGLYFAGGPLDGLTGRLSPDGSFEVVLSSPLPLQGVASGTLVDDELSAELTIAALDLAVFNDLINTSAATVRAGTVAGSLRVSGLVNDPDLFGVLRASGVIVDSSLTPEPVGPVAFVVAADEKTLTIGLTRPQRGPVPLSLSGTVHVGHWSPVSYQFNVLTANEGGVPVDYRFGPIAVDGVAHGRLTISGDGMSTRVSGQVSAQAASVFIDNAKRADPRRDPFTVDVQVTTGRGVELTWPSQDLPILHTLLDDDQVVEILYDGFTGDYSVVGDVEIRGGDLFFYDRSFYLKEGMVSFAENEGRFDPVVSVRAETRERALSGESLRIYLDADARLSALSPQVVRVSSEPPRQLSELRALLGSPFGDGVAGDQANLLALAGGVVSEFGLVRPMERVVRQSLGLDLFSIRSELVENLLRTPLGLPSADLLDDTTIVVGKYLGDDLFFEALVRVESDDVSAVPELRTDLEVSLEWATPFFLLEWSLLPSLTDLFATDNFLSLSWRFDY